MNATNYFEAQTVAYKSPPFAYNTARCPGSKEGPKT